MMSEPTLGERFVHALGTPDWNTFAEIYHEDVVLYAPLAWKVSGFQPIRRVAGEFHQACPGLLASLHDEFRSAYGDRAVFRFSMDWHMKYLETVVWRMDFPKVTPDPVAEIVTSTTTRPPAVAPR
jgi:hypothetical protein